MSSSITRSALLSAIHSDPLLARVLAHVESVADDDAAHDIEHLLRVALATIALLDDDSALRECVCAALLHDVVNLPKDHPERQQASRRSAEVARRLLSAELDPQSVARVAEAIEDHSFSTGRSPRSALGAALQDADRLEALGALGIARTFSTGVRLGARYFDPEDPWAERRSLDDKRFSLDHFFTKLLALPRSFCTANGRREAEKRVALLRSFVIALADEIGSPVDLTLAESRAAEKACPR